MEKLSWCLPKAFITTTDLHCWDWKVFCILPEKKSIHQSNYRLINLQWWSACMKHKCNNDINIRGVTSHFLTGFKVHFMKWNSYLTWLEFPRT